MVHYLNANQGFVMAVLTAVYVVATVILVALVQRQASLAQKSLDFASRSERAKYRPYVIFDIVYDDVVAYARLKNSGTSPAIDVRVSVSPRLRWKDKERGIGFIEKGVPFLAPGRELSEPFGWGAEFFKQYPDLNFTGSISYVDSDGDAYSENFAIGLSYLEETSSIGKIDLGRELEGIRKALERFQSSSFTPLVRTIGESEYATKKKLGLKQRGYVCARPRRKMKGRTRPNQALERTADRRVFTFNMIKTVSVAATRALVSGRSTLSR